MHVQPAGDNPGITVITAPGLYEPVLSAPGDYVIVRAERAGELDLHVRARRPGGSIEAQFELNRVALALSCTTARSESDLDILAHIAHRGDGTFGAGDWIGGPADPARIEGLEIRWPTQPDGVSLVYSVVSGGHERRVSRECEVDEFAGTRGLSRPLVGLRLRLTGPKAEDFELRVEALFQGCGTSSATGRDISLAGPTGNEALTGLRLSVETVTRAANAPRANPASRIVHPRNRVHVFRNPDLGPPSSSQTA